MKKPFKGTMPDNSTLQNINIGRNEKREVYFLGIMKDVRIWKRALKGREIKKNYTDIFDPSEDGWISYWPLNEGQGSVVHSLSSNSSNGEIYNGSWILYGYEPKFTSPVQSLQVPTDPVTLSWANRKITYSEVSLNGQGNVLTCFPGDRISVQLKYNAKWVYNANDYCPGCVVQVYYGMEDIFSVGIIEHGVQVHTGSSSTSFNAPAFVGIYYITQKISLDYHFLLVKHPNQFCDALAVVQVLPLIWTPQIHHLLPQVIRRQIITVLSLTQKNSKSSMTRLPKDLIPTLFSMLIVQSYDLS